MKHQKQLQNVEYFNYLGGVITNDTRCTCGIKSMIFMTKATINKNKTVFTSKLDLNLKKKLVQYDIWCIAVHGAEIWTLGEVDQKCLEGSERWCWRRMEKVS
jgi:hypothetical protein